MVPVVTSNRRTGFEFYSFWKALPNVEIYENEDLSYSRDDKNVGFQID